METPWDEIEDNELNQNDRLDKLEENMLYMEERLSDLEDKKESEPEPTIWEPGVEFLGDGGPNYNRALSWQTHDMLFNLLEEEYVEKLETFIWWHDEQRNEREVSGVDQPKIFTREEIQSRVGIVELKVKAYFRVPSSVEINASTAKSEYGGELIDGMLVLRGGLWLEVSPISIPEPLPPLGNIIRLQAGDDPEEMLARLEVGGTLEIQNGREAPIFKKGFGFVKHGDFSIRTAHEGNRPIFMTGNESLMNVGWWVEVRDLLVENIQGIADGRVNPKQFPGANGGIRVAAKGGRGLTLRDVHLSHYSFNVVFQSVGEGMLQDFAIEGGVYERAWNHWNKDIGGGHSSGIYASRIQGLDISGALWDHNGWHESAAGGSRTKFNHNLYIQDDCVDVSVRDNWISRGAAHGLQLRPGGEMKNNLFWANSLGAFNGPIIVGGDAVTENNAFMWQVTDQVNDDGIRGNALTFQPTTGEGRHIARNNLIQGFTGPGRPWAVNFDWQSGKNSSSNIFTNNVIGDTFAGLEFREPGNAILVADNKLGANFENEPNYEEIIQQITSGEVKLDTAKLIDEIRQGVA